MALRALPPPGPEGFREPPHSIEAEQALLGALLCDNRAVEKVRFLKPESFYEPAHQRVFERMLALIEGGRPADPITTARLLIDDGKLPGNPREYLASIMRASETIVDPTAYAIELQDLAARRALVRAGEDAVNAAYDLTAQPTPELIADLRGKLQALQQEAARTTALPYALLRDLQPRLISTEIVTGLIPRRGLGEVHAEAGGGKTAIIVDLMLHIAAEIEYRGRRVERTPVVYVALEGHAGIENRIIAAAAEIGVTDAPFALVKSSDNFREPATSERVAAIVHELGGKAMVVIDTYTAALGAGGSDCRPEDVTAFLECIKTYLLSAGCTVMIVHHFGKDATRGGRGWSGLNAALDFELEIDRDGDLRTMRVTKSRDGSDSQPAFCYRLAGREIGANQYGEPVTAVVVEHLADEDTAKPGKRQSPRARAALNLLWTMIKDSSRSFPLPEGGGKRCVIMKDFEAEGIKPGVVSNCKREQDRSRPFKAALEELIEAGTITIDGARVYPTPKENR